MPKVPPELTHQVYCDTCFVATLEPAQAEYEAAMARAKETIVFFKDQGKETRLIRRLEEPVHVTECADREETLLRLAFLASQKGYNAIIDIDIVSKKVRSEAYQTMVWSGSGIPVELKEKYLIKDRTLWKHPN